MATFPTSLFDFDFDFENYITTIDRLIWRSDIETPRPMPIPAPDVCELPEVIAETIIRLEALAYAALDENRMDAYFRLLDEIERYKTACADAV